MKVVEAQIQRAQALIDVGRHQDAIPLLHQALGRDPNHHQALCLLSLAHFHGTKYKTELGFADRAIAAGPDREWGHRLRSLCLMRLQKTRPALAAAEESVQCAPHSAQPLHTLVQALLRAHQTKRAQATAERLRVLAPESPLAHESLALVALNRRRWKEAEGHTRRALALRPESYFLHYQLGMELNGQGRAQEAAEAYYRALQISPTQTAVRAHLKAALSQIIHPWIFFAGIASGVIGGSQLDTGPGHVDVWGWMRQHPIGVLMMASVGIALWAYGQYRLRRLPPHLHAWWKQKQR